MARNNKRAIPKKSLTSLITNTFLSTSFTKSCTDDLDKFYSVIESLEKTRGLYETMLYLKRSRLCITRFISGSPLRKQLGVVLEENWPKRFLFLKKYIGSVEGIKWILTLFTILRNTLFPSCPDLDPITRKSDYCFAKVDLWDIRRAFKELGIRSGKRTYFQDYHISTKKGPMGHALLTSFDDLSALPPDLYENIGRVGGARLASRMNAIKTCTLDPSIGDYYNLMNKYHKHSDRIRKLSYFCDKEGKTRIIAILDYWSQTALKPLHDEINSILKRIPADCTFNQNHFINVLPREGPFFSFDLSNATDRMPIKFQRIIIDRIIGRKRGQAWEEILIKHPYEVTLPNGELKTVYYEVGQPMGAYSSWPAMALTHHLIVKVASFRAGLTNFWDYTILGDDIVIANANVAQHYKELLKELDIPISEAKTHVSNEMYEFAKRWVYKNQEVTPFSIGGLLETWKRYPYLQNFLQTQHQHGWSCEYDRLPGLVQNIYRIMGKGDHSPRLVKLFMVFHNLVLTKQTKIYDNRVLNSIKEYFGFAPIGDCADGSLEREIIRAVQIEVMERDLDKFNCDLYTMIIDQGKRFRLNYPGLGDQPYRFFAKENIPLYNVVFATVDKRVEIVCKLTDPDCDIDKIELHQILLARTVSTHIFSQRIAHTLINAQARMVKLLIQKVKELSTIPKEQIL